jgi:hypothetical protein
MASSGGKKPVVGMSNVGTPDSEPNKPGQFAHEGPSPVGVKLLSPFFGGTGIPAVRRPGFLTASRSIEGKAVR